MKMHLASTDYGNFLQNEPSPISTTTLAEKCTVRRAAAPSRARASPFPPLNHASPALAGEAGRGVQLPEGAGVGAARHLPRLRHVRLHD